MREKTQTNTDTLSRLLADADRRIDAEHGDRSVQKSVIVPLLSAHVFVITSCATAIAGVTLIGLF